MTGGSDRGGEGSLGVTGEGSWTGEGKSHLVRQGRD